jgi:hypothetical protein
MCARVCGCGVRSGDKMRCAVGGSEEVIRSCVRAAYWDYNVTRHTRNAILRGIEIDRKRQRERDLRLILVITK